MIIIFEKFSEHFLFFSIPIAKPLSQSEALYRKLERADQSLLEEPSDHSHHASNFEGKLLREIWVLTVFC